MLNEDGCGGGEIGRFQVVSERYAHCRAFAVTTTTCPIALEHPSRTTTTGGTTAILHSHVR